VSRLWANSLRHMMSFSPDRSSSALCWTQQDCDGAFCLTQRGWHVSIIECWCFKARQKTKDTQWYENIFLKLFNQLFRSKLECVRVIKNKSRAKQSKRNRSVIYSVSLTVISTWSKEKFMLIIKSQHNQPNVLIRWTSQTMPTFLSAITPP